MTDMQTLAVIGLTGTMSSICMILSHAKLCRDISHFFKDYLVHFQVHIITW